MDFLKQKKKHNNTQENIKMSSITEIRQMGSILQRKSRGRIWNNDASSSQQKKKKHKKSKEHYRKNWDKDLWD